MKKSIFNKHTSIAHVIENAVNGWKNEHVLRDIDTYGSFLRGTCYGCMATNALCELSGITFYDSAIIDINSRAKFLEESSSVVTLYEDAIDYLRKGKYYKFLCRVDSIKNYLGFKLDIHKEYKAYVKYCTSLRSYGIIWYISSNDINNPNFKELKKFLKYLKKINNE